MVNKNSNKVICTLDVIGKVNTGFTIIAARDTVGDYPAYKVLGYRKTNNKFTGPTVEYVTWTYNAEANEFNFGHYMMDFNAAVKDFNKRD